MCFEVEILIYRSNWTKLFGQLLKGKNSDFFDVNDF